MHIKAKTLHILYAKKLKIVQNQEKSLQKKRFIMISIVKYKKNLNVFGREPGNQNGMKHSKYLALMTSRVGDLCQSMCVHLSNGVEQKNAKFEY